MEQLKVETYLELLMGLGEEEPVDQAEDDDDEDDPQNIVMDRNTVRTEYFNVRGST